MESFAGSITTAIGTISTLNLNASNYDASVRHSFDISLIQDSKANFSHY